MKKKIKNKNLQKVNKKIIKTKPKKYYLKKAFLRNMILNSILVMITVTLCFTVFFKIENIIVDNNSPYEEAEILQNLEKFKYKNLLLCNLNNVYKSIYANFPEIDSITSKKTFPNTINISVNTAKHKYSLKVENDYFIISENKKIIKKTSDEPIDLLKIYNVNLKSYNLSERAYFENITQEKLLDDIVFFAQKYKIQTLTSINLEYDNDILIKINNKLEINLGNCDNLENKISNLAQILKYKINPYQSGMIDLKSNSEFVYFYSE